MQQQQQQQQKVVVIGVAADSGCGKSTFMRRLTSIFGGDTVGPLGGGFENGGWETNSLVSDLTTVLCLDDYHLNDRGGRKVRCVSSAVFVTSRQFLTFLARPWGGQILLRLFRPATRESRPEGQRIGVVGPPFVLRRRCVQVA